MYEIVIKKIGSDDYDTPMTSKLYHVGDIIPINGEKWIVISGGAIPK